MRCARRKIVLNVNNSADRKREVNLQWGLPKNRGNINALFTLNVCICAKRPE